MTEKSKVFTSEQMALIDSILKLFTGSMDGMDLVLANLISLMNNPNLSSEARKRLNSALRQLLDGLQGSVNEAKTYLDSFPLDQKGYVT